MVYLLGLAALGGLFLLALLIGVMHIAGWRVSDLRDVALNHAYGSFTYEGELIPGARPGAAALLVIRLLAEEDDARNMLAVTAMRGAAPR
ncbi:MAG: hypothetical protein ACXVRJ_03005 [Gaiellaceae bacterium]